jgi:Amt family ammonium transporter
MLSTEILLNVVWVVLMAVLGLGVPVGVGVMAAGPAGKGRLWVAGRLLLAGALAFLVSLACGFSLQYGFLHAPQLGESPRLGWQWAPFGEGSGLLAWGGPLVPGEAGRMALFLLQALGAVTVVVLALAPAGQRLPGPGLLGVGLLVGGALYPLLGHWVWGGGWLAATGWTAFLGHGFVDWGGAGVYYTFGGLLALAGLLASPARLAGPVPAGDNGPCLGGALLALLGITAINLAGAWGLLPRLALVALNTWTCAAVGGLVAGTYMAFTTARFRPGMLARGLLAGAAASAGLGPFAPPTTLLIVGVGAGLCAVLGSYLVGRVWKLDDPAGVVPTFGLGGLWGVLAVGLFADGTFGQGLNGVGAGRYLGTLDQGVGGIALLAPGVARDFGQMAAQLLGLLVILVWALGLGWLLFRLSSIHPRKERPPRREEDILQRQR